MVARINLRYIQAAFLCCVAAYVLLWPLVRDLGIFPVVALYGLAIVVGLLSIRHTAYTFGLLLVAIATVIFILSLAGLMPRSWPTYLGDFIALRQYAVIPGFVALTMAFDRMLFHLDHSESRVFYSVLIALASILVPAVYQMMIPSGIAGASFRSALTIDGGTNSQMTILAGLLLAFVYSSRALVFIVPLFASVIMASTSQVALYFLVSLGLIALPLRRLQLFALLITILAVTIAASYYPKEIHSLDPNAGVRALIWHDVFLATIETLGTGVGFGTASIQNLFFALGIQWSLVEEGATDLAFVGTHSSYVQILFRLGIFGCAFFLLWLFKIIISIPSSSNAYSKVAAISLAIFIVSCSVNVAISSVNSQIGSALLLAIAIHFSRRTHLEIPDANS